MCYFITGIILFHLSYFKIFLGSQMFATWDCLSPSCHSAWAINNHLLLDHQWFKSPFWSIYHHHHQNFDNKMFILQHHHHLTSEQVHTIKYCYNSHHPAPEGVHSEPLDNCSERRPCFTWWRGWGYWYHHKVSFSSFNILSLVLIPTWS